MNGIGDSTAAPMTHQVQPARLLLPTSGLSETMRLRDGMRNFVPLTDFSQSQAPSQDPRHAMVSQQPPPSDAGGSLPPAGASLRPTLLRYYQEIRTEIGAHFVGHPMFDVVLEPQAHRSRDPRATFPANRVSFATETVRPVRRPAHIHKKDEDAWKSLPSVIRAIKRSCQFTLRRLRRA